jgi:D-3-phosphoglycerate dehydrogenase / 2-oxoglutarate reductase
MARAFGGYGERVTKARGHHPRHPARHRADENGTPALLEFITLASKEAATAKGIPVTNCPDTFIEEVADHAMMLLLATHRRCIEQDRMVREGRWAEGRPQLLQIPRLMGQTLGFIGFGRVARATARRARAFGLHMKAFDPYVEELTLSALGVEPASLSEVLSSADFVSMHLPDTPETRGFLKEHHFRQMKKNAIFITTGRGPTVNEAALIKALEEKWIAGAGLDVFEIEPTRQDNPLHRMPHVILSPHNASASSRFDPRASGAWARNWP